MSASSSSAIGVKRGTGPSDDRKKRNVVISGFEKKGGFTKRVAEELELGILKVACPRGEPLVEGSESFKAYKYQYKRLCTHFRQNGSLAKKLACGELPAERVAAMDDEALMADTQRSEREQFRQEGLQEALGLVAEDSAHWTPTDNYTCPKCDHVRCIYIQTFKGSHSYDDNNQEPAITIRCTDCKYLWKEDEQEGGRLATGSFLINDRAIEDVSKKKDAEAPSLWHEEKGRREPTWLLPASS